MKINKSLVRAGIAAVLSVAVIVTACSKSSSSNPGSSSGASSGDAASLSASAETADNAYNDAFNVVMQTGTSSTNGGVSVESTKGNTSAYGTGSSTLSSCATVTVSPEDAITFPKTITVDFGSGCTSLLGYTRKGSITYTLSGPIFSPGTTISATFNNYSVNGYQLGGTYAITNNSTEAGLNFTTVVTGGNVIFPDSTSSTYTYSGTKTVVQTAGIGTLTLADDSYNVFGKHTYSSSVSGKSLVDSIDVNNPLVVGASCTHITKGIIDFVYTQGSSSLTGTFDYGTGACDADATVTIGAFTKAVVLPW
ncbi:MAG: hypothetical protein P4L51_29555 [Puia sp.]|nr:hypothetical protein [Puia sp.]